VEGERKKGRGKKERGGIHIGDVWEQGKKKKPEERKIPPKKGRDLPHLVNFVVD